MGERPGEEMDLVDSMNPSILTVDPVETAISTALKNRPEIKAEETRTEAARIASRGSAAERLPTIQAFADYGNNGSRDVFVPTNTVGLQLQIPLFDGGRRSAHRTTAESQERQAEIRARDLRDEIEFDVRVAVDNLASAREQLRAARSGPEVSAGGTRAGAAAIRSAGHNTNRRRERADSTRRCAKPAGECGIRFEKRGDRISARHRCGDPLNSRLHDGPGAKSQQTREHDSVQHRFVRISFDQPKEMDDPCHRADINQAMQHLPSLSA
jgi:hypothetical protein